MKETAMTLLRYACLTDFGSNMRPTKKLEDDLRLTHYEGLL